VRPAGAYEAAPAAVRPRTFVAALLRCSSSRFGALYFVPFYAGAVHAGRGGWTWGLLGAAYWFCFSTATELTNRVSDRVEDEVNRPERTAYCQIVGYRRIAWVSYVLWAMILIADAIAIAALRRAVLAVLLAGAAAASINYSYGPRLKRRWYLVPFVITFPVAGTFLIGWALGGPYLDRVGLPHDLLTIGPFAVTLGGFLFAHAGVKDITDIEGDRSVGYDGVVVRLVRASAAELIVALAFAPFLFLLLMVAVGALPTRLAPVTLFLPVSLVIAAATRRASTPEERAVVRESVYYYWFAVTSAEALLFAQSFSMLVAVVAAAVAWMVLSRTLHWSGGLVPADLRTLSRIAARPV